jgi:uncharacterized membrane protein (DUF485 family)
MAEERQDRVPDSAGAPTRADHHPEIDWIAAERSPEFRELTRNRRRFVLPATIFFLSWYFGFIILAGYAEDFMGESIYEGFTVGYLFALSLRKADRDFDPLARKAAETAVEAGRRRRAEAGPASREEVRPS